ncbi:MAG: ATP-binding protein [Pyrinomonadaceae bacterium]|nr:ATP-binding protein [Sphingobacteriaceae bacterium]
MDLEILRANASILTQELEWLNTVIQTRMFLYWGNPCDYKDVEEILPPDLENDNSVYASVVKKHNMNFSERIILLMALAPHLMPQLLDVFFIKNANYDRGFTEFGGTKGLSHGGFIPTGETAVFVLAGNSLSKRLELSQIFDDEHFFKKFNILTLDHNQSNEPFFSGILKITSEYLSYFTSGKSHKPAYSTIFPAKLLTSKFNWGDLVLEENIMDEIMEINDWIKYKDTIMTEWGMSSTIKPGFRTLFYGPPGTGKTLTASLLGKAANLDVYRIDLSMVVSKYIGETEKNLSNIFDQAENKNWILFFDEADALFGKRTQTSSSNDRHANQEVSYLLQRVEDFPGLVILATNFKANVDEAFSRRFQSMIYFPLPGTEQRKQLWKQSFSEKTKFEKDVNMDDIAKKYELAGGAIINVVRYCTLKALKRGDNTVLNDDILTGIRREFGKDGKTVN